MKRTICFILFVFVCVAAFTSCSKITILNSAEAKEKLEKLGYVVTVDVHYGDQVEVYEIDQVTILTADKGDDYIQVYYFTNENDTNTFYDARTNSLTRGVEVAKKNKYSIYRGTEKAVEDFLN